MIPVSILNQIVFDLNQGFPFILNLLDLVIRSPQNFSSDIESTYTTDNDSLASQTVFEAPLRIFHRFVPDIFRTACYSSFFPIAAISVIVFPLYLSSPSIIFVFLEKSLNQQDQAPYQKYGES